MIYKKKKYKKWPVPQSIIDLIRSNPLQELLNLDNDIRRKYAKKELNK